MPSSQFQPIRIAVLTISMTRTFEDDKSGDTLAQRIKTAGHILADRKIVRDSIEDIKTTIKAWCDDKTVDCVITTGGTGLTGQDVTPEACQQLFEKEIPGFGELFRAISYQKIGTSTIQSRALGGVRNGTYIFALPGSTGACKDAWDDILLQQLDSRYKPCNFIDIMPRLKEPLI